MIRRAVAKRRENSFNLTQHVNEVLLPSYNALKDPFLIGFFENPIVKKNLKETGVIKKKRRMSVKPFKNAFMGEADFPLSGRKSSEKGKSLSKSVNLNNQIRLPALDQFFQNEENERAVLASSASARPKRIYKSSKTGQQV